MTIQDWGAVGELVSGVAVIATLVYLAVQIKQNTNATRAEIHQLRSDQAQNFFLFAAGSREIAELITRVRFDPGKLSELDEVERYRVTMFAVAAMQRSQNMYFQKQAGFLAAEIYDNQEGIIFRNLPLWEALGIIQSDSFGRDLERIKRKWSALEDT